MSIKVKIFDDLKENNVKYFVWKNSNLIEEFFDGKENLDLFIHQNDREKFKILIKKNNWIEAKSTSNNVSEIKHYLFFEHNKILHIHAYFKIYTGNSISKNYDLTNFLDYFQNIHFEDKYNMWVLNYNLQLKLIEIRILLKKKSILGKYLLLREKKYYQEELSNILKKDKELNLNPKLINSYIENLIFKKNKDKKKILESIKNFRRINSLQSNLLELFFLIKIIFKKILRLKKFKLDKKIIIFLSGADSSGKTSITNDLEILFQQYFKTKKFSIGKPYPKFFIKHLIKKNFFKKKKLLTNNKNNFDQNLSLFQALKNVNLAFFRYIYSLNIFYLNPTTNVILLDRYLSQNTGDVNGPRIYKTTKNSLIKKILSNIEKLFYKQSNNIDHEYKIMTDLKICLLRNQKRYKDVKKTDEEIIERFNIFNSSRFKSKKIFKIDNNLSKKDTINNILCILSKNINENN